MSGFLDMSVLQAMLVAETTIVITTAIFVFVDAVFIATTNDAESGRLADTAKAAFVVLHLLAAICVFMALFVPLWGRFYQLLGETRLVAM